jgi:hypothetical protein
MREFGRKYRRGISDINVVPYIDVMLVLLIIFMILPQNPPPVDTTNAQSQLEQENQQLKQEVQRLKQQMAVPAVKPKVESKSEITSLGLWVQYVEVGGRWVELGRFRLERNSAGKYGMVALFQSHQAAQTYEIRNVNFDEKNNVWSFYSDLGANRLVYFELRKIAEGTFEGWSSLQGVRRNHNVWKKMSD